ncbi:MAG TPA: nucleotidyltransferase family protein [Terriglobales bacterium]|jgi:hypothetical protein|nr:nucleotidyltransferase family protein [Terriglobales bacterium]
MNLETGASTIHSPALTAASFSVPDSPPYAAARRHPGRFNREFDFLLLCAASNNGSRTQDIRESVGNDLNWQTLLRIAEHHRLIPQVYNALRSVADLVPREPLEKLHDRYQDNARQTLRLTRDLIQALKHFETRRIPVLAYKGPALATILNRDFTGRQFADIDLLVHPSAVQKSKAALADLGYTPQCSPTDRQQESLIHSGYEYAFDLPDAQNVMELKWRVLPRFYSIDFDVAGFFSRAITIDVSGHPVRTLCPDDLLLVLCVHAAKHAWSELSLLWDISQLIQSKPINWESVYKQADQLGIRRILDVNLALVRILLGNPFPSANSKTLVTKSAVRNLNSQILAIIRESEQVDTESVSYFRLLLKLRERRQDRARFLWRLLVTPSAGEWSVVSLPAWLFPFYQVVRMFRLAARLIRIPATGRVRAEKTSANTA